jgi:hypothetical protein
MATEPVVPPADAPAAQQGWLERLFRVAFLCGLMILAFLTGAVLTAADVFPGTHIDRAYFGAKAVYERITVYRDVYTSRLWYDERKDAAGVTVHDPERAQDGVTLYTSGHDAAAHLIDMDGEILHTWRRPFSTVWEPGSGIARPKPDTHVWFRRPLLFPNGDLLTPYETVGDTPYGYGLVKLDRDSEVLWTYFGRAHHDVDVGPDGRVYVLTHEIVDQPLRGFNNVSRPRLDDFLVVLSPDGEELKKISLIHAVAASDFRYLLHTVSWYSVADVLHTNTVEVIDEEMAANFPFGEPGQVLLSMRELNALAVLDVDTGVIVWVARGPWIAQHDPDILPNGNILLFDNWGNLERPNGISRVLEFDPRTMGIVWQYAGTAEQPLASEIRSSQQRLPNGNTLISESDGGRLVEVTREGEIVWEFMNPVRGGEDGTMIPIVDFGQRFDPASFDPEFREVVGR